MVHAGGVFPQNEEDESPLAALESLIELNTGLHLCAVREDVNGRSALVGSAVVEWRKALVHGRISLPVELISPEGNFHTQHVLTLTRCSCVCAWTPHRTT